MSKQKLLVSVSGGRTSALMAFLLNSRFKDKYDMVFVFANTSREKEETLVFVNNISLNFGIPIVWVEAVVNKGRKGTTHRVTSFEDAVRDGSVFESVIQKYGIPNNAFLHCTRELKTAPIRDYIRSIGWGGYLNYKTAIGYRSDEPKRATTEKQIRLSQWYPLWELGIKKSDVATFWLKQSFDLGLSDFDGNCKMCYKKSDRKILTQVVSNPDDTWIEDMEGKYSYFTAGREKAKPPFYFFRNNRPLSELKLDLTDDFKIAVDKSLDTNGAEYDFDLDEQEDCAESCEPFGE